MSRIRTVVEKAVLSYLSVEWVGALLAYAVALVAFALLIGYLVVVADPGLLVFVPFVAVLAAFGLVMLWKALGVPRALLRLARSLPALPAPVRHVEGIPGLASRFGSGEWRATRIVDRMDALRAIDEAWLGARSGALSMGAAKLQVRDLSPSQRPRRPDRDLLPVYSKERRIPEMVAEPPAREGAIRIVDLAGGPGGGRESASE